MNPTLARLRRILVMVPWLLDHPGVAVEEVARRFESSPPEILDDLDLLGYCGLPGYGGGDLIEASVSGGQVVVRMAEFFARPLSLSMREGLALLLAARATRDSGVLGNVPAMDRSGDDAGTDGPLITAIAKLEAHLGARAEVPVAMDLRAGGAEHLAALWPAVTDHRVVDLTYQSASKNETTVRQVEPWTIRLVEGAWYLQGYCRSAQDQRSFRLDRVKDLQVTEETAPDPPDDVRPPVYRPALDDPLVVIEVSPQAAWIADHVVLTDRTQNKAGWSRLQFQTTTLDWAARLLLRLGDQARVIAPQELADLRRSHAQSILALYDGPESTNNP